VPGGRAGRHAGRAGGRRPGRGAAHAGRAHPHAGLTWLQALGSRQAAAITAVLSFFTGFLIADGYSAYQQLLPQLAGVQHCCQHVIRRARAVTRLGSGSLQSWAADVIDVLREAHQAVEEALARGDPALDAELLAKLRGRYDQAAAFGITHNRHRDWHDGNHPGYALGCWLRDYKEAGLAVHPRVRRRLDEQLLRAGRQSRQTASGRLRILAHPPDSRPVVPHSQLPRFRCQPRADSSRRHHSSSQRKTLAPRAIPLNRSPKPRLAGSPEWTPPMATMRGIDTS
jgi:Transposase IS66 family